MSTEEFFTVRITRPQFEVEFKTQTADDIVEVMKDNSGALAEAFRMAGNVINGPTTGDTGQSTNAAPADAANPAPTPARRGRRPAAEAAAPPPMPVPPAAMAPVPGDPLAIPPGLQRDPATNASPAVPAAPAPPPPPLLPPAAAPPVAPPVTGPVGAKVIAYCEPHLNGPDKGQALADWFAGAGLTIKGATLAEVVAVIRMTTDDKLASVAQALAV